MAKEHTGQRVRLYVRGTILGFKRTMSDGAGATACRPSPWPSASPCSSRGRPSTGTGGRRGAPPTRPESGACQERTPMMRFSVAAPTLMDGMEGLCWDGAQPCGSNSRDDAQP
ncbi:hypothetical protein ZWY2020_003197 [Hordeum vulgare]|nr:hypothetical protein ZWY2020_003197 [Hordeum vulgare]